MAAFYRVCPLIMSTLFVSGQHICYCFFIVDKSNDDSNPSLMILWVQKVSFVLVYCKVNFKKVYETGFFWYLFSILYLSCFIVCVCTCNDEKIYRLHIALVEVKFYFLFIFHFQTSDSIIGSSLVISGEIGGFQREESQDVIRDIDWSTRNVMLGYDVAGISPILLLT